MLFSIGFPQAVPSIRGQGQRISLDCRPQWGWFLSSVVANLIAVLGCTAYTMAGRKVGRERLAIQALPATFALIA